MGEGIFSDNSHVNSRGTVRRRSNTPKRAPAGTATMASMRARGGRGWCVTAGDYHQLVTKWTRLRLMSKRSSSIIYNLSKFGPTVASETYADVNVGGASMRPADARAAVGVFVGAAGRWCKDSSPDGEALPGRVAAAAAAAISGSFLASKEAWKNNLAALSKIQGLRDFHDATSSSKLSEGEVLPEETVALFTACYWQLYASPAYKEGAWFSDAATVREALVADVLGIKMGREKRRALLNVSELLPDRDATHMTAREVARLSV